MTKPLEISVDHSDNGRDVEVCIVMTQGEYDWLQGVVKSLGASEWECMKLFLKAGALAASSCSKFIRKGGS